MQLRILLKTSLLLPLFWSLTAGAAGKARAETPRKVQPVEKAPERPKVENRSGGLEWNVLAGAALDSQTVKLTSASQVSMNGLSELLRLSRSGGFSSRVDSDSSFRWEAGAGVEKLNASASSPACGTASDCQLDIIAVAPFARAGWLASESLGLQLRAGADFLMPVTSKSNLIDAPVFRPLAFGTLGLLTRIELNERAWLPIAVDYAIFLGSPTVSFNRIVVSLGYSWR